MEIGENGLMETEGQYPSGGLMAAWPNPRSRLLKWTTRPGAALPIARSETIARRTDQRQTADLQADHREMRFTTPAH